jgi:hypothetical protein
VSLFKLCCYDTVVQCLAFDIDVFFLCLCRLIMNEYEIILCSYYFCIVTGSVSYRFFDLVWINKMQSK